MEGFSDGVFSIAITLLVLEIGVPSGSGHDLLRALADQWPSYLAYLVSFATIGAVWFAHTVITGCLDHATSVFMRLNLLLLLVVSFLPFPTRLLAEYVSESGAERVATTVLGIDLLLAAVLLLVLWRCAVRGLVALRGPRAAGAARPGGRGRQDDHQAAHARPRGLRGDDRPWPVPAGSCRARLPGHRDLHSRAVPRDAAPLGPRLMCGHPGPQTGSTHDTAPRTTCPRRADTGVARATAGATPG
jgi:uncharacterized membrane protein